jgi:hypothetical protein
MYEDTLKVWVDKAGKYRAEKNTLEVYHYKDLLDLKSKDASIVELQNTVKEYKKRLVDASFVGSSTSIDITRETSVMHSDTMYVDSLVYIYPKYSSNYSDEWLNYSIDASRDSVRAKVQISNRLVISKVKKRQGLFKPKKTVVNIKNLSPYTKTTELEQFEVIEKKPKITIGLGVGYGISFPNGLPTLSPYIGINAGVPLISF